MTGEKEGNTIITQAIVAWEPLQPYKLNYSLEDVVVHPPTGYEVLVEVQAAGICHTDNYLSSVPSGLHGVKYPKVAGHEGAGVVRATGCNVESVKVGDRVLLSFYSCGSCTQCEDSHPAYCEKFQSDNYAGSQGTMELQKTGTELWSKFFGQSSFSRYTVVREESIVNVETILHHDDELKLFAPLGCGFQTGMGAIRNVIRPRQSDTIVILGMGAVGMGALMTAKINGCKAIVAVDLVASRLELAKSLGATHTINMKGQDPSVLKANILSLFVGGANIVLDTTGARVLLEQALECTCKLGKLILIGVPATDLELGMNVIRHVNTGRSIIGCIEGDCVPRKDIPQMIRWYREGKFPIDRMVQYFDATDFQRAMACFKEGSVVKPVLVWS